MQISSIASVLTVSVLIHAVNGFAPFLVSASPSGSKFYCGKSKNVPTTLGQTRRGPVPIIRWTFTGFGENYSPEERCKLVSQKFQAAYENGTLNFLKAGYVNKNPVICAVPNRESPCSVLFTLKPGSDPNQTLKKLLNIRDRATSDVLNESIVPTDATNAIDMNDFLENAPVDEASAEPKPIKTTPLKGQPAPESKPSTTNPSSGGSIW